MDTKIAETLYIILGTALQVRVLFGLLKKGPIVEDIVFRFQSGFLSYWIFKKPSGKYFLRRENINSKITSDEEISEFVVSAFRAAFLAGEFSRAYDIRKLLGF